MFGLKHHEQLIMPITGQVCEMSASSDQLFASKAMGDGFVVKPTGSSVVSPVAAKVVTVFPTKHAIGLKTKHGVEILIHMGVDTVELAGKPFTSLVTKGQQVSAGTTLTDIDMDALEHAGKSNDIMVIFTDKNEYKDFSVTYGDHESGHDIGEIIV